MPPMTGRITRAAISYELTPGLKSLFFQRLQERPTEYQHFFNIETDKYDKVTVASMYGFGLFAKKDEGNPITYDSPGQGWEKTVTHETYALGFRVTKEAWQDGRYGNIKRMPEALARSARLTVEYNAAADYNLGTTTTLTADGVALFSASHPIEKTGELYGNIPGAPLALSATAIKTCCLNIERTPGPEGFPCMLRCKEIVIPLDLKYTAAEILKSQKEAYTADNQINSLMTEEDLTFKVWHFLTDAAAWFGRAEKRDLLMPLYWRQYVDTDDDVDFDTGDLKFKADFRFSHAVIDWRGHYRGSG